MIGLERTVLFVLFAAVARGALTPSAEAVYGQPSFTSNTAIAPSQLSLSSPGSLALDSFGNLYVVDSGNRRVLMYEPGSTMATRVYGQPSFGETTACATNAPAPSYLCQPGGVAVDSHDSVWVTDMFYNMTVGQYRTRMFVFAKGSTLITQQFPIVCDPGPNSWPNNDASAIVMTTDGYFLACSPYSSVQFFRFGSSQKSIKLGADMSCSATGLSGKFRTMFYNSINSGLFVPDQAHNRVVKFLPFQSTSSTWVAGSRACAINEGGVSSRSLNTPNSVFGVKSADGTFLYIVADSGNNRVLMYRGSVDQFNATADVVFGQSGLFSADSVNDGGISAGSLSNPTSAVMSFNGTIYISDTGNNRVLRFASIMVGASDATTAVSDTTTGPRPTTSTSSTLATFESTTSTAAVHLTSSAASTGTCPPASCPPCVSRSPSSCPTATSNAGADVLFMFLGLFLGCGVMLGVFFGLRYFEKCWFSTRTPGSSAGSLDLTHQPLEHDEEIFGDEL